MKLLVTALVAMFGQQTAAAIGRILPAVIAPAILVDLSFDPAWVGAYFGMAAFWALLAQVGCGSFIIRYGALRVSQVSLLMVAGGLALMTHGSLAAFVLSAVLSGGGSAISTPASSHLLGRYAPPQKAPLVFSLKQTAVPVGLLLAGFLGPLLTVLTGWRGASLIVASACVLAVLALQPLRREFDSDRVPTQAFRLSDLPGTLASVISTRELRGLSFACFAFNSVQTVMSTYFVVYLTTLGYTLAAAGVVFSLAVAVAIPGRILWGWLGSTRVAPRTVMAGLSFGMAVSVVFIGLYESTWPTLLIGLGATALSATALSWHGIVLSEAARLAPEGKRGAVTGGVLSFGQVGGMAMPLAYALLLGLTGSYAVGFIACALPPLLVGIELLRGGSTAANRHRRPGQR